MAWKALDARRFPEGLTKRTVSAEPPRCRGVASERGGRDCALEEQVGWTFEGEGRCDAGSPGRGRAVHARKLVGRNLERIAFDDDDADRRASAVRAVEVSLGLQVALAADVADL